MNPTDKKSPQDERKEKIQLANIEKEKNLNLIFKVISWKTGAKDSRSIQNQDKITPKEWQLYKEHIAAMYKAETPAAIAEKLEKIKAAIIQNDGFE